MAKEASLCLLFLFFLIISCSGSLVGFSYRERGDTSTSAKTISFLRQKNVSMSQIRIFVTDHRILSTLSNSIVPTDLYLNRSQVQSLITSKPSELKARLLNFLPHSNIKSIIASCGSECLAQNEMPLFSRALKSIGSVLRELHIGREVKISVAFPLSYLEKLNTSHENSIRRILSFIREMKSFVMVEDSIDGELSMESHFVHAIIKRASLAASVLPCKDVPIVLTMKSTVVPTSLELAQFSERVSKYLEAKAHVTKRIAALYAEVHGTEDFTSKELKREEEELFPVSRREMLSKSHKRRSLDDTTSPTNVVFPTNPASSTPIITPPDTPTIITVPATNPVTISPSNPAGVPVTVPSTTPVSFPPTNPANTPVPVSNPATTTPIGIPPPTTNPVTSPPSSGNVPVTTNPQPQPPPANTNAPAIQGQSWCVAKQGSPEASLQAALDYACGMGGSDCSQIQQGGNCYSPVTLQNHASFAFNSYYQKNPAPTSCDFGGTATLVNTNPSSGSCVFPSSSSSTTATPKSSPPTPPTLSSPTLPPPSSVTPTPSIPTAPPTTSVTGPFGYGTPPSVLNSSNPASGTMPDFGSESPPVVNTTSASHSMSLRPSVGCILLMVSLVTMRLGVHP
ncbi:probable glucan endo-1,3-beta-glucosidase A6 [Vigna unguiculata]|uniref:probable glucan endo-1,3-beta-glucosidase A6 n=1 Tax=Vigna unguiculata TaxID=3917 RepID=UPI001016A515|nr:probable glucan endo-1,3-beta-glucosidase A6 [Vigna unguiculata]